jgi:dTDP-N-acetylfucosamine:lipid II N-acetylfucosaminyltransferase
MVPDKKFTIPLKNHILYEINAKNHFFLFLTFDKNIEQEENVATILLPFRKFFFSNIKIFLKSISNIDFILTHAAPSLYLFLLAPNKVKKIIWVYHGGIDIPKPFSLSFDILELINILVKKRIRFHTGHMIEDSNIINKNLRIKAKFLYNPAYLSNTWNRIKSCENFIYLKGFKNVRVLVGNSTDPHNNHIEAFEILNNSNLNPLKVCSLLSYGKYEQYKNVVIEVGTKHFGDKFLAITQFLELNKYLEIIDELDFIIFNHDRAEATGATIQLLSLAKPIFFNPISPAYQSLKRRGYIVFDIYELEKFRNIESVDLRKNRELLIKEYSIEVLNSFYKNL